MGFWLYLNGPVTTSAVDSSKGEEQIDGRENASLAHLEDYPVAPEAVGG